MSLTPEQMEIRRTRIGSSEVGAILGLDPYKSALDVFIAKSLPPEEQRQHQEWGLDLEPAILQHHARLRGLRLLGSPGTLTHPSMPLCATPDALAEEHHAGPTIDLQAKNDQGYGQLAWGEPGTDAAPLIYIAQVTVELGILRTADRDVSHGEIAVSIRGAPPVFYRVDFDAELFGDVADLCAKWKRDYLDTGLAPPGSTEETAEYIRRRYAKHNENMLEATPELTALVGRVRECRYGSKLADQELLAAETALKAAIGEAQGIAGLCTWKLQKRAATVVKESSFRVLRLTPQKEG